MLEIAPGIKIEDRLRLGGVLYLERRFDKPLTEVFELLSSENPRFSDMTALLTALYMQANTTATEEQAEFVLGRIELAQISEAFGKIKAFELSPKNGQTPEAPATVPQE